jgi:glutamine amidotransferase
MCELLGVSCNQETRIRFSFAKLAQESRKHRDGWGIGYYRIHPIHKVPYAVIFKEPIESFRSELSLRVSDCDLVKSRVIISHIRRASTGSHVPLNTHPFELALDPRKDSNQEKSWIFAHNGTIDFTREPVGQLKDENFPLHELTPHGDTDSEYAFCYIMNVLRESYVKSNFTLKTEEKRTLIERAANSIDDKYSKSMNFLISDGHRIYAYYSGYDRSGGLWYLLRQPPHKNIKLKDERDGQEISLDKAETEFAAVIATTKLTVEEQWQKLEERKVYCFEDGALLEDGVLSEHSHDEMNQVS